MQRGKSKNLSSVVSGRASPEAIQKRRVARRLNDLFTGRTEGPQVHDGRTEKRRQRLLAELEKGTHKNGVELTPIEVLQHVDELLGLDEPLGSIRKAAKTRTMEVPPERAMEVLQQVHAAYGFRAESYRFLGVSHELLVEAGIVDAGTPRRGRPPKLSRG